MKTPQLILLTALMALTGVAVLAADPDTPLEIHGPKPAAVQLSPRLAQRPTPAPKPLDVKKNVFPPRAETVMKPVPNSLGGPNRNRAGAIVPNVKPAGSINGTALKPKP